MPASPSMITTAWPPAATASTPARRSASSAPRPTNGVPVRGAVAATAAGRATGAGGVGGTGGTPTGAARSRGSWSRIACSSSASSGEGDRPSSRIVRRPSSARRSASAWRPDRYRPSIPSRRACSRSGCSPSSRVAAAAASAGRSAASRASTRTSSATRRRSSSRAPSAMWMPRAARSVYGTPRQRPRAASAAASAPAGSVARRAWARSRSASKPLTSNVSVSTVTA